MTTTLDGLPEELLFEVCSFLLPQYESDDADVSSAADASRGAAAAAGTAATDAQTTQFPIESLEILNPSQPSGSGSGRVTDDSEDDAGSVNCDFSVRMSLLDREVRLLSKIRTNFKSYRNRNYWYRSSRHTSELAKAAQESNKEFLASQRTYDAQIRFVFGTLGLVSHSMHQKVYSEGFWHRHIFTYDYMSRFINKTKEKSHDGTGLLDASVFNELLQKCRFSALHLMYYGYVDDSNQKHVRKEKQKRGEELRSYDPLQAILGSSTPVLRVLKLSNTIIDVNKFKRVLTALAPTLAQLLCSQLRVTGKFEGSEKEAATAAQPSIIFTRLESLAIRITGNGNAKDQAESLVDWILQSTSDRLRCLNFTYADRTHYCRALTLDLIKNCVFAPKLRALTIALYPFVQQQQDSFFDAFLRLTYLNIKTQHMSANTLAQICSGLGATLETLKIKLLNANLLQEGAPEPFRPFQRLRTLRLHTAMNPWYYDEHVLSPHIFTFFKEALAKQTLKNLDLQLETRGRTIDSGFLPSFVNLEYMRLSTYHNFIALMLSNAMPRLSMVELPSESHGDQWQLQASETKLPGFAGSLRLFSGVLSNTLEFLNILSSLQCIEVANVNLNGQYNSTVLPETGFANAVKKCAAVGQLSQLRSLTVESLYIQRWSLTRSLINMMPQNMRKLHLGFQSFSTYAVRIDLLKLVSRKFTCLESLRLHHPVYELSNTVKNAPQEELLEAVEHGQQMICMPSIHDAVVSLEENENVDAKRLFLQTLAAALLFPNAESVSLDFKYTNISEIKQFLRASFGEEDDSAELSDAGKARNSVSVVASATRALLSEASQLVEFPDQETQEQAIELFIDVVDKIEQEMLTGIVEKESTEDEIEDDEDESEHTSPKDLLEQRLKDVLPTVQSMTFGPSAC